MDRVLDRLWIGDSSDLDGRPPLRALGFAAVLDLRDGLPSTLRHDVDHSMFLTNRDGDPWAPKQVEDALDFVAAKIRLGRVLVACAAGMSRSASMVIGYLVRAGFDPGAAYAMVRAARPRIAPVAKMMQAVMEAVR